MRPSPIIEVSLLYSDSTYLNTNLTQKYPPGWQIKLTITRHQPDLSHYNLPGLERESSLLTLKCVEILFQKQWYSDLKLLLISRGVLHPTPRLKNLNLVTRRIWDWVWVSLDNLFFPSLRMGGAVGLNFVFEIEDNGEKGEGRTHNTAF